MAVWEAVRDMQAENQEAKCWPVIDEDGVVSQIECSDGRKYAVWSHDWFF